METIDVAVPSAPFSTITFPKLPEGLNWDIKFNSRTIQHNDYYTVSVLADDLPEDDNILTEAYTYPIDGVVTEADLLRVGTHLYNFQML